MDLFSFDNSYRQKGFRIIAGIDEAGRGPLAGPVVAAAVILPEDCFIEGINDSKKLSPVQREKYFEIITKNAISFATGVVSNQTIDELNILRAAHLAMNIAVTKLASEYDIALIDGLPVAGIPGAQEAIVAGDSKSASIAAASIVAKVTRDAIMNELAGDYPDFGFSRHKGYGTKEHLEALKRFGPCPIHRKSFSPVKEMVRGAD